MKPMKNKKILRILGLPVLIYFVLSAILVFGYPCSGSDCDIFALNYLAISSVVLLFLYLTEIAVFSLAKRYFKKTDELKIARGVCILVSVVLFIHLCYVFLTLRGMVIIT
ncbi:MAG: hypothetical protein GY861_19460 [bacterium]|nr:hypothetical protein [bacterium]